VRVEDGHHDLLSDASAKRRDPRRQPDPAAPEPAPAGDALVTAEVAPGQPERGGTITLAAAVAVDHGGVRASAGGAEASRSDRVLPGNGRNLRR
jgi:hypothetical protein